jgi:hypothetical protein
VIIKGKLEKPTVFICKSEDGSILIEWVFDHKRINIHIEKDYKESGWNVIELLPNNKFHTIDSCGSFEDLDGEYLMSKINED